MTVRFTRAMISLLCWIRGYRVNSVGKAALGHWRPGPFGCAAHALGQGADRLLAPASESHRIKAEAEHGDAGPQRLTARLGRGHQYQTADHRHARVLCD